MRFINWEHFQHLRFECPLSAPLWPPQFENHFISFVLFLYILEAQLPHTWSDVAEADVSSFPSPQVQGMFKPPPKPKSVQLPAKSMCQNGSASQSHHALSVLAVAVMSLLILHDAQHWLHVIGKTCSRDKTLLQQTSLIQSTRQQQQDVVGLMEMISLEKRTSTVTN